ncbi:MAG: DUF3592 domain-containing protein [Pirellulaceae bacterium]|nr:DUF3592 domain-containing protein [Planctomycetales bacterium]
MGRRRSKKHTSKQSLSLQQEKQTGSCGGCAIVGFGLVFASAGGFFLWMMAIWPLAQIMMARSWEPTPCVITSSQVETHRGDDGDTYSVEIEFDYTYGGRQWHSDQYDFFVGSSSGRRGKQAVVDRHKPGSEATCYVNPRDPQQAVLNRSPTSELLWGFFPMIFIAVGVGVLVVGTLSGRNRRLKHWRGTSQGDLQLSDTYSAGGFGGYVGTASATNVDTGWQSQLTPITEQQQTAGPLTLKQSMGPWAKLLGGVFITLFWNGIVAVFVWQEVQGFMRGRPEWFLTLFLIPFQLIGLGMIAFCCHAFLALFNPVPVLTLLEGRFAPGSNVTLQWNLWGRTGAIRKLTITLHGEETARYRRGTSTYTDRSTFHEEVLLEQGGSHGIASGTLKLAIPTDKMHSFEGSNNKILWTIKLHADIPMWPDVKSDFQIKVLPRE